jgi:hypothetical protein
VQTSAEGWWMPQTETPHRITALQGTALILSRSPGFTESCVLEIQVLIPRPKLLGFHMPGPATRP